VPANFAVDLPIETVMLILAGLLVLSVVASKMSDRFGIPSLLVFLGIGMLAGSEGIGGIYFDNPKIAQAVGFMALAVILFSGGLDTPWQETRKVLKESWTLATLGVLLTALLLGFSAHLVLKLPLTQSMLLGAIASSTDAAAVFAVLRSKGVPLRSKISATLELESGSNDPMAAFLTIGLIQLIQMPGLAWYSLVGLFFIQMLIGVLVGYLAARLLLLLINTLRLGYAGLYPVMAVGMVLFAFAAAAAFKGSGFLAVRIPQPALREHSAGPGIGGSPYLYRAAGKCLSLSASLPIFLEGKSLYFMGRSARCGSNHPGDVSFACRSGRVRYLLQHCLFHRA